MPSNLVKYSEFSIEEAEIEQAELDAESTGAEFLTLPAGQTVLRFLPPVIGKSSPFRVIYQHFIEVPGVESKIRFVCPAKQSAKDKLGSRLCISCARADELRKQGHPSAYKMAGNFMAKRRVFSNVISRAQPERGVLVFPFGKTIHEQLLALRKNQDTGGNYCDPVHGFDIVIDRKGMGQKTEYNVMAARNLSPLGDPETMDIWLSQMNDLDRYAQILDDEEIRTMMGAIGSGGGGGSRGGGGGGRAARGRSVADDTDYIEEG